MESSGPDTKVRGPAAHIYERYLQLARDAASSGDRVLSENYLQHADHYFRLVRSMQPAVPLQQTGDRFGNQDGDYEGDEDGVEGEGAENEPMAASEGAEQPEGEFPQSGQQQQPYEREGGEFRRRRGRRNRFRPGGEGEGSEARSDEGGGERTERTDRPERSERPERVDRPERTERPEQRGERRERAPRERTEAEPQEGFSTGPKPAFLGSD